MWIKLKEKLWEDSICLWSDTGKGIYNVSFNRGEFNYNFYLSEHKLDERRGRKQYNRIYLICG